MNQQESQYHFRPRARLLQQLGDQLIGTPRLAVFELVKNAYDADASGVNVSLVSGLGGEEPSITVSDDGSGMSESTIKDIWLVIAHDHKEKQLKGLVRTDKGRLPLGSKGLGRLSVHKLGNKIELVTRAENELEVVVNIDWSSLIDNEFLEDAKINVETRDPLVFVGGATGTQLKITELRNTWTRGEVRRLYRQITSISSPFGGEEKSDFVATLEVPNFPQWIEKLPDPESILELAPWVYDFNFDGEIFNYTYEFKKITGIARESRTAVQTEGALLVPPAEVEDDDPLFSGKRIAPTMRKNVADLEMLNGIGPISGRFYVFDLSPIIASRMGEITLLQDFLKENGGIRVYRDGMRVYDYGEKGNDWLGLDLKRVNNPTKGLSRNIIVGHVKIEQENSSELIEKSNREGFIENDAYDRFKRLVIGAIEPLQTERELDRKAIRELLQGAKDPETHQINEPVAKIRDLAERNNLSGQINPLLDRIETEYGQMKERLLSAGISGTSLAVVFHEIEQGVRSLYNNLKTNPPLESISDQIKEMMSLLDGFSDLLRKKDRKHIDLNKLVRRSRDLNLFRFRHHNIKLVCPPLEEDAPEVKVNCSFGLTLGALTNLLDNAIYWMGAKWPEDSTENSRAIYLNIEEDFDGRPAIIIADTGPGFNDLPNDLVRPFFTRRPDGMGMGLYFANMVMQLNDGEMLFPDHSEVDIPDEFTGAVVALRFPEIKD